MEILGFCGCLLGPEIEFVLYLSIVWEKTYPTPVFLTFNRFSSMSLARACASSKLWA